jgi:TolB protein
VDGNMDIYLLDIATLTATRLTNAPQKDSAPSWSADGTLVAFESFRDGNFEIYVTEAIGATLMGETDLAQRQAASKGLLTQKRLTTNPTGDHSPLWSPTRMEIAFQSDQSGNGNIYLVDVDGNQTQVTTSPEADFAHSWSPDGNLLAYKIAVGGDLSKICVIERTGQNPYCVTKVPSEYSAPVWSPDGKFLAASAKQTKGYGIDVFRVTDVADIAGFADTVTHLFNPEVDPRGAPFWAPDGLRLVVQAKAADGNMDLFSVLIPANEFTRLTKTAAYDGEPVWVTK